MTSTEQITRDREGWLRAAADEFRRWIKQVSDIEVPDCRISMGYGGVNYEKKVRGVCWHHDVDGGGLNQIFITPEVDDTATILAILLHELVHAALNSVDDPKWNHHGGRFAEYATRMGLCAPFTTATPGIPTLAQFMVIAAELGDFPHAALKIPSRQQVEQRVDPAGQPIRITSGGDPQRNRWISAICPTHRRPYRASRAALNEGLPDCGVRDENGRKCGLERVEKV
jgi:hypothetical protein